LQGKVDVKNSKPYLYDIIVSTICEMWFRNSSSFGVKFWDYFATSLDGRDNVEIPMQMIALVATCVHGNAFHCDNCANGSAGLCCSTGVYEQ
jgi:hypothetical protein